MGSNFELAQIRLADGKVNEIGKRCDLLTNIYLTCECNKRVIEVNRFHFSVGQFPVNLLM